MSKSKSGSEDTPPQRASKESKPQRRRSPSDPVEGAGADALAEAWGELPADVEEEEIPPHTYTALARGPWSIVGRRDPEGLSWLMVAPDGSVHGEFSRKELAHLYVAATLAEATPPRFALDTDGREGQALPVSLVEDGRQVARVASADDERLDRLNGYAAGYEQPEIFGEALAGAGSRVLQRIAALVQKKRR